MSTDMVLSAELTNEFQNRTKSHLSVMILTAGSWPLTPQISSFHPYSKLANELDEFTQFYAKKHNGRKLTWLYHLSKGNNCLLTKR